MSGNVKVIDKDGDWFVNRGLFRFVDGDSGAIYEPGVPTKVKDTAWRKAREDMVVAVEDPFGDPPKKVEVPSLLDAKGRGKGK